MGDGVKFIFKTLFKVPIIIFTTFFIFNILVFFLIYFKMLGFSYVVMQTAVENNYLPNSELSSLLQYAQRMDTENQHSQHNTSIIVNFQDANDGSQDHRIVYSGGDPCWQDVAGFTTGASEMRDATKRKQYGSESRVGVYTDYTVIWPLDYRDTLNNDVAGFAVQGGAGNTDSTTSKTNAELEALRNREFHQGDTVTNNQVGGKVVIPIRIVYTVPGLKYYPDLINY